MAKTENQYSSSTHNLIATGTTIKGEINTTCDIRIDGTIEGIVTSKGKVVIGDNGLVNGEIKAANVDIMGAVKGEINATDTLSLKSSGKIDGNIKTTTLIIEQGAQFNGNCKMGADKVEAKKEK